jgi:hypothetical protein
MIDPDKIYTYFDENHGPLTRSTNGWYDGECPYCGSRKLALRPDSFFIKCWKGCFYGNVVDFVRRYLGTSYYEAREVIDQVMPGLRVQEIIKPDVLPRDIVLPEGYNRILDGETPMAKRARLYLKRRGFDLNYLDMIGIGYCGSGDYMGYIIVPFKKEGSIVYYIARDFLNRGDKWRYKNPPTEKFGVGKSEVLFNEEALYLYDKVYLLEGWTDAASIGNEALSTQGKSLSLTQQNIIVRSPVKEVVVISDLGAEMEALSMLQELYRHKKTKLIKLTGFSEYGKDVNAIGAGRVLDLELDAPYINDLNSFVDEARSLNTRKKKLLI